MNIVFNQRTGTVHKPGHGESTVQMTSCGILRHVPHEQIHSTTLDALEDNTEVDRCGLCFEQAGGY